MKNVIMSQLYQLKKNRLFIITLLGLLILNTAMGFLLIYTFDYDEELSASFYVSRVLLTNILGLFAPVIITAIVCADDFADKTANYDLMSGTLRSEVFLGKLLLSLLISAIAYFIIFFSPIILITALYGWGNSITFGSLAARAVLALLPLVRWTCFTVMLSFIIRNPLAVIIVSGTLPFLTAGLISRNMDEASTISSELISYINLQSIFTYHHYVQYGLNTEGWLIFDSSLSSVLILKTVLISAVMSAIYLIFGYSYYHREDLN